jgi:putative photosynthetic complex assembly protein
MTAIASPLPRASFIAVVAILGGTLVSAAAARLVGFANPSPPPPVVATVDLHFFDLPNGTVAVRNADTGGLISTIAVRGGGFLRSSLHVLAAERAADHFGPAQPFRLTEYADGRLALLDTATGQQLELEAFGPSNESQYLALLPAETAK